jgi:hypothetical protein
LTTSIENLIKYAQATPYFDLEGYMERDWLVTPDSGFGIRIHHILRSDADRVLHDHPWPNTSVVLRGGYWEIMPEFEDQTPDKDPIFFSRVWRKEGDVIKRKATTRHRIEIPDGETAVSMFIMGPYEQQWGFYTPTGKVYWREYLNDWTTETYTDKTKDD